MELHPIVVLPSSSDTKTNWNLCVICQSRKKDLRNATDISLKQFKDYYMKRKSFCDSSSEDLFRRLQGDLENLNQDQVKWHRNCYSNFTNKVNIQYIEKKFQTEIPVLTTTTNPDPEGFSDKQRISRSTIGPTNIYECIFCQKRKKNKGTLERLIQVQSKQVVDQLRYFASIDDKFRRRLGAQDPIATEIKYHRSCLNFYKYNETTTTKSDSTSVYDIAFIKLVELIDEGFESGHVYSLSDLSEQYNNILASFGTENTNNPRNRCLLDKLTNHYGDKVEKISPNNRNESTLIFPKISVYDALRTIKLLCNEQSDNENHETLGFDDPDQTSTADQLITRMIYHVAQKIKYDLYMVKGIDNNITDITQEAAAQMVPESLQTLLNLILSDEKKTNQKLNIQTLSIGQDIIFAFNGSLTPKHVGLGLTLHQATRSKKLIEHLHAAGNSISYDTVRRIETGLANHIVKKCDKNIFIPENLSKNRFTHFAVDNIDILEETLDGKGTFHGTQLIAFQRGAPKKSNDMVVLESSKTLKVPPDLFYVPKGPTIKNPPVKIYNKSHPEGYSTQNTDKNMIDRRDMTWLLCRSEKQIKQIVPSWTQMNKVVAEKNHQISTIGYTPILPNPAHETDTLFAVLHRCQEMTKALGQKHTVITADEALYCKLKQIQWHSESFANVVVRLGGFHLVLNFLRTIGKHFSGSGLPEIWIESNVFGENTALNIMEAKHYNRAIRALKLTCDALWRVLMSRLKVWATENNKAPLELREQIKSIMDFTKPSLHLMTQWQDLETKIDVIIELLDEFDTYNQNSSLYQYWRSYLDLAGLVLKFIRAEREGDWALHLKAVSHMLPWFFIYDRINYARWGSVYLADMESLNDTSTEVFEEFSKGNFVVKETKKTFNEKSPDLTLEHVNKVNKIAGGLIGITKKEPARNRWCLTFNTRSHITEMTTKMFGLEYDDSYEDTFKGLSFQKDINKLVEMFENAKIFEKQNDKLINIYTGETASDDIVKDLLSAHTRGIKLAQEFKTQRLIEKSVDFYNPIKKVKAKTFNDLYKLKVTSKCGQKDLSVNANALVRHMLSAVKSGRNLNLKNILQNELRHPPPSLFDENGELRQCSKSTLANILIEKVEPHLSLSYDQKSTALLIDGQAVVQSIGKPKNAMTFGELADIFLNKILSHFKKGECCSVHVLFDRYNEKSIKSGTRQKRRKVITPVEYKILDASTPLPKKWDRFIHHDKNKANLTRYLSNKITEHAVTMEDGLELLTSGGFEDPLIVKTNLNRDTSHLASTHEEADTRFVIHAIDTFRRGYETLIVNSRDTDVLLLLIHFYEKLPKNLWLQFGTSSKPKFVPIHQIVDSIGAKKANLLAFHALTGCDTTSSLSGYAKLSCWKVFDQCHMLLEGIGSPTITPPNLKNAEKFVILVYSDKNQSLQTIEDIDDLRAAVFHNIKSLEKMPPTKEALKYHIHRANYQALIWKSADISKPSLPPPEECGWRVEDTKLMPIYTSKPSIPLKDLAFISCQCKTACRSARCGCVSKRQKCMIGVCHVGKETCQNVYNIEET